MYHYLDDKEFVSKMRNLCGDIMQDLCHILKEDYDIGATFYLVGSGARNLIMQNNNEPVDLDYNLEIIRCEDFEDCRYIKECVRKSFNKALKVNDLDDCNDSTVPLTTELIYFTEGNDTEFRMDVCITARYEDDNYYYIIIKGDVKERSEEYATENHDNMVHEMKSEDFEKIIDGWVEELNINVNSQAVKRYTPQVVYDKQEEYYSKNQNN